MGWGDPTHTRQLNLRGPLELHTKGKEGPLQTKTQAVEVHLSGPALQRLVAVPRPAWPGAALPGAERKGMMATGRPRAGIIPRILAWPPGTKAAGPAGYAYATPAV